MGAQAQITATPVQRLGRLGVAAIALLLTGSTFAGEMQLQDVYNVSGQYSVAHLGAGNVVDGAATLGSFNGPIRRIAKAYLYWLGSNQPASNEATDDTITFSATTINGTKVTPVIADVATTVAFEKPLAPGDFFWDANHRGFVADVTDLIRYGDTTYAISDFDMDNELGVGLQIVYQDEVAGADTTIYQGHDYAFRGWYQGGELNRTHVLNHTFEPSDEDRQMTATFFVGGGDNQDRPDQLWYQTGEHNSDAELPANLYAANVLSHVINANPLEGGDGSAWDTVTATVDVPAGSTFASFQFQSGGGTGTNPLSESFSWLSASITMVPEPATLGMLALGGVLALRRRR